LIPFSAALLALWAGSLVVLLRLDPHQLSWWGLPLAILLRSQLHTGLFIVAHDAMHGGLWPSRRRWNDALGAVALLLYAALPYGACRRKHQRHHSASGTAADPDFCVDAEARVWRWYGRFMAGYLSWPQMAALLGSWALLFGLFRPGHPWIGLNVLLFCTLPLLLSSLQLFVFGTYLPHRPQRAPALAAEPCSLNLPVWLSLLACYHFGYHREHHDHPTLRWFELPRIRAQRHQLTLDAAVR
jgi:beta-carotene ketolase (CrtW type)